MTIAILATGDELVHGDTLNTNSHEIAHILSSEGLSLGVLLTCSDNEQDIKECLNFLLNQHDIIIITGGLGPTTDDLTRFALAACTGDRLVEHPKALAHIQQRLQGRVALNEGNRQQCMFPERAELLPNPNGTAMGCCYHWNNKTFFLLPGPPRECLPMFNDYVIPKLQQTKHSDKELLKWRIFGVAESEIAQTLETALEEFDCQTGYRLETPYLEFKVRCSKELVHAAKKIIDPILLPHIIASTDKKASDTLRELILSINEPIAINDGATGGILESLLIRPGIHHLLKFNGLKTASLNFQIDGLDEYWSQQTNKGTTQLIIHYSDHSKEGGETHTIPYRSPLVVYHAAEWLSFRLFHLINQLHQ